MTVAAVGMSTLLSLLADTGHDQLWLLLAVQRMGPTLNPYGATVLESNPPLAVWLSAIVVAIANLLHLSVTVAFKLAITLVATTIGAVCAKLIRVLHPEWHLDRLWLLGIGFVIIFGALPVRDFGQRDHVLALLVLPYLTAAALDLQGRRLAVTPRVAITFAAAIGIALKPHQALIPIAIELTILLTTSVPNLRRNLIVTTVELSQSPTDVRILEPAIFLLTALTYLVAIRTLAPTYLTDVLPILRDTYWALGGLTLAQLLRSSLGLQILLLLAILIVRRKKSAVNLILLTAAIAADVAYIVQGTGWYYQQLPAISFASLAVVFAGSSTLEAYRSKITPLLQFALVALTLLAFALTIHFSHFQITPRGLEQSQPTPDPTFFADLPAGTAVATLTTSVDDTVPPAFRYHLILAQRYPHLWMLPAILRNESGAKPNHPIPSDQLEYLDRLQHQFMIEDLNHWHPALILVARCQDPAFPCQTLEDRRDNLLTWFRRDPAFSLIFSRYHFLRSSGPYDAYILN